MEGEIRVEIHHFKCNFCLKDIENLQYWINESDQKFHFDCWIKDMVNTEIDKRLKIEKENG